MDIIGQAENQVNGRTLEKNNGISRVGELLRTARMYASITVKRQCRAAWSRCQVAKEALAWLRMTLCRFPWGSHAPGASQDLVFYRDGRHHPLPMHDFAPRLCLEELGQSLNAMNLHVASSPKNEATDPALTHRKAGCLTDAAKLRHLDTSN